jgi:hypothetical protein
MVIGERQRRALHERLIEVLGVDKADALMEHLPSSGWGDVARRSDIRHLERMLETKIDSLGVALRGDMAGLAGELRAEMAKQSRTVVASSAALVVSVVGSLVVALVTLPHGLTHSARTIRAAAQGSDAY